MINTFLNVRQRADRGAGLQTKATICMSEWEKSQRNTHQEVKQGSFLLRRVQKHERDRNNTPHPIIPTH